MEETEWMKRCALRLASLGMPGMWPATLAEGAADRQREINGASAAAWECPEDVAERYVAEDNEP